MARPPLPQQGDSGPWGDTLNTHVEYLGTEIDAAKASKGQPNGLASLDATGKVPSAQLPAGSGSATVHADLSGLDADDHLQYLTQARGDALYAPVGGGTPGLDMLTRAFIPGYAPIADGVEPIVSGNTTLSNATQVTSIAKFLVVADASDLRYCWVLYNQSESADFPNNVTIKAAATINGVIYPLYFDGVRTKSLVPGQRAITDPLPVSVQKGDTIYARTWSQVASAGQYYPNSRSAGSGEGYVTGSDLTDSGTITGGSTIINPPTAVVGHPTVVPRKIIGGFGSSSLAGTGDQATSKRGWMRRALNANYCLQWIAIPSSTAVDSTPVTTRCRLPLLAGCTHIVCGMGRNDIAIHTLATAQTALLTWHKRLSLRGAKVYQATLQPETTSIDGWTTTGGQTIEDPPTEAERVTMNAWIRAGCPVDGAYAPVAPGSGTPNPYLAGYIEFTDPLETARDSGIWKANHTSDGLHPNPTGHAAVAATIDPEAIFT